MMNDLQERIVAIQSDIKDKNEYSMAISKLEQILITDPNNADAYYLMGLAYQREEKYDTAIYYLIKSYIINPQNSLSEMSSELRLELCIISCKDFSNVEKFSQYVEMLPNSSNYFYFRGLLLYNISKYESAITEYSKAFENSPQNTKLYYNIARCYNKNGECDKAVAEYENYLKFDAKSEPSNICIEIAFMFIENNRFNDALLFFNNLVNIAYDKKENDMELQFCFQDFIEHVGICTNAYQSVPENWSAFSCGLIMEIIAMKGKIGACNEYR